MTALSEWQNFYVIIGSSAGALTGLQFVVMAFTADLPVTGDVVQSADAFGTPTVVHFGVVLLLSALLLVRPGMSLQYRVRRQVACCHLPWSAG